jgi:hypothetical protein
MIKKDFCYFTPPNPNLGAWQLKMKLRIGIWALFHEASVKHDLEYGKFWPLNPKDDEPIGYYYDGDLILKNTDSYSNIEIFPDFIRKINKITGNFWCDGLALSSL